MDGSFSRLDEMDNIPPLGHEAEVRTGTRATSTSGKEGGDRSTDMAVPSQRIGVKKEVVVETSERLTYNDRLY